jgi:quinoprotein glucose dehydrogenase
MPRLCCVAALLGAGIMTMGAVLAVPPEAVPARPYAPRIAGPSQEGQQAIRRFQLPHGCKVDLVAAEPLLANPVCFCFDGKGRLFVAETFRMHAGVTDDRSHGYWLKDDLACRTVADRVALYRKYHGKRFADYSAQQDRVRLLEDTNGDGIMDRSTVFAGGFNAPADGLGAGLLAQGGNVYYTCIPHLWQLRDSRGDGQADFKKSLQEGYGVHVSFIGHDLHGLTLGPDGRLYFSIGDRGLNVQTEGRTVACPDSGAVLRCELDGSGLEIVATGLRNPQELAFDKYGNLFTADNNADSGDAARWVHVVEGGDSGWRIGYQYMRGPTTALGPWNAEKLWHLAHAGEAAYRLPPLAHIANGPAGLTYDPGTSLLPERYRDHFFLVDFRGSPGGSGIHAFRVQPKGASFELVGREHFLWGVLATDTDFGPDGALYLSDWVDGWNLPGKGRIYKVFDPRRRQDAVVVQVRKLLAEGFDRRPVTELTQLLAHADRRVRQQAQLALAGRGKEAVATFVDVVTTSKNPLARLHAIWGLGQVGRHLPARDFSAGKALTRLTRDDDAEIRAQAARVLGDVHVAGAAEALTRLLKDAQPHVRFLAALSLGRVGDASAIAPILDMLRENEDRDAYLRHAGVMALVGIHDRDAIRATARDGARALRLAALLAMRRLEMPEIAGFLADADPQLVVEAARAINDVPINVAMPQLASLARRTGLSEPVLYRVINANFRLGKRANAEALASLAGRSDLAVPVRVEALKALADWANPSGLDRVVNLWRPLAPRPQGDAVESLRSALGAILTGPDRVRAEAVRLAAHFGIRDLGPALLGLVGERQRSPQVRIESLRALEKLKDGRLAEAVTLALADGEPRLRAEARRMQARHEPARALPGLEQALARGTTVERQAALAALGQLPLPAADTVLSTWLDRLLAGKAPPELQLDLLQAAAQRHAPVVREKLAQFEKARSGKDHLATYRETLFGGDAEAGRRIFFERADVSCVRCHKVQGTGGEVGPDLSMVGKLQTREYLLESVVDPNRQIAKGYETVVLVLTNGQVKSGILKREDATRVQLMTPEGGLVTVAKAEIEERTRGRSAMPDDVVRHLSKADLRDLVEFLTSLR